MASGQFIRQHRATEYWIFFLSSRCTWELLIWGHFMLIFWPEVSHTTQINTFYPGTVIRGWWLYNFTEILLYI